MCENFVLHHAATVVIRDPAIELCLGVALVRGEAIPLCCLHVVLRYASAFLVHGTQGGCVVGSGKRSTSILERTCRHWHTKAQQQNAGSEDCPKRACHDLWPSKDEAGKSPVSAIPRAITSDRSGLNPS